MAGRIDFAKLGNREGGTYVVITGSVTPSPLLRGGKDQGGTYGGALAGWLDRRDVRQVLRRENIFFIWIG